MDPTRETAVVTSAGRSRTDDRRLRTRRYLITQGVRVVCVLLAVLLPVPTAWRLGFIAASVLLPWFGVIAANAGPTIDRRQRLATVPDRSLTGPGLPALETGRVIDADG